MFYKFLTRTGLFTCGWRFLDRCISHTKIALNLYAVKKVSRQLHRPAVSFGGVYAACNLKCLHCGSDCQQDTDTPEMALPVFLNVLDSIAEKLNSGRIVERLHK